MNIEHLKLFCLVVEEGSISQAARLNYMTQPAVTRHIHHLEDVYGALLFDRTNNKLTVTKIGELLYSYAKTIVNEFNQSQEAVNQAIGKYNETLRVGASFTLGEYYLPNVLGRFKKQNAELNAKLSIKNTPSILEDLANDLIDIAFVEGIVQHSDFTVEKLAEDELILVCSTDHPWKNAISIDELENERMIWREANSGTRQIVEEALRENGILSKLNNFMEIGSTQAIKSAVEADLGVSILPKLTVLSELASGRLREISINEVNITRNLWIVKKTQRFTKKVVRDFFEYVKAYQS
ncbi:LysR family transcriptional regulator [Bacillus massiliigorillae]|uniref:LysR family transcriptional regulator n=1 Tax=Bacillus massiliigorillae TaxID=1243664 RepID=UPI0005A9D6A3|nr:LysR family transcriptional regulator [Bacillus massiliigorillae]